MCEFGEYVKMIDYTENAVKNILFNNTDGYFVDSSDECQICVRKGDDYYNQFKFRGIEESEAA